MINLPEITFLATPFYAKIKCEPNWKWPIREKPLENYDLFYVWNGMGEVTVYRYISDPTEMETLLSRYVHLRLSTLFGAKEEANLILKQLMILLLRSDQNENESKPKTNKLMEYRILEVANYVREHPAAWFKIIDLANRAQLSPRYFSAKFKQLMGINVQDYEIQCRLERAEFFTALWRIDCFRDGRCFRL